MATLAESLLAACVSAAPTEVGKADAMLAKMSTDVPLPSFNSVIVSAICTQQKTLVDLYLCRLHKYKKAASSVPFTVMQTQVPGTGPPDKLLA